MNNNFKCLELPCGEDGWVVEVKDGDDMRQLFAKIKDYAYFVSGNKFEGHSSWKLHKAAEALTDLWMAAHAMSYFRVLSIYDSISTLLQKSLWPILNGFGKLVSAIHLYTVLRVTPSLLAMSSALKYSCFSFSVIFMNLINFLRKHMKLNFQSQALSCIDELI